jgi:triacylglycerol lipase
LRLARTPRLKLAFGRRPAMRHHVLLVPGFFGFGRLGDLPYFSGVSEALIESARRLGLELTVSEVPTLPTASIRKRAAQVVESLAELAGRHDGPIHVIGHSTGGLDARLALATTASLPTKVEFKERKRVRSLLTVACPHFGTPAAVYLLSGGGRRLFKLLVRLLLWLLGRRLPLRLTLVSLRLLLRLRHPFRSETTLAGLDRRLLGQLGETRRRELSVFLESMQSDQALFFQLTPEACDLLNACTGDPELRYGSVVTRAARPSVKGFVRSLRDVYAQLLYPIYAWLYRATSRQESRWIPKPVPAQAEKLEKYYGELPAPEDNDGVVPTNSQIWGEVVHAASGDHLDVVGQFAEPDWLPSYSDFDQQAFEALWADVAGFIAACEEVPAAAANVGKQRTESDMRGKTG